MKAIVETFAITEIINGFKVKCSIDLAPFPGAFLYGIDSQANSCSGQIENICKSGKLTYRFIGTGMRSEETEKDASPEIIQFARKMLDLLNMMVTNKTVPEIEVFPGVVDDSREVVAVYSVDGEETLLFINRTEEPRFYNLSMGWHTPSEASAQRRLHALTSRTVSLVDELSARGIECVVTNE